MDAYIFGAKATAAGLYKALLVLKPEINIRAFVVSELEGNVKEIWGCPVRQLSELAEMLSDQEKQTVCIYVAVPELIHTEIRAYLNRYGFFNLQMLDSHMEAEVMGEYFDNEGRFPSIHKLKADRSGPLPELTVYSACFYRDKPLKVPPVMPDYMKSLYLGCDGAEKKGIDLTGKADFYDNIGENISCRNSLRCEMTAHYWIWKNRLNMDDEYVGICHYRRILDLSDEDLKRVKQNAVDVVLPYPMLHYPNAGIQHTWYVPEKDWKLMEEVVNDLYPEYGKRIFEVFSQPFFYNYNMLLAKKDVFSDYCAWLFPILDRIEELSEPKGTERSDRYTAYLSESLETLYFMVNMNHLKIYHTGRLLFV